MRTLISRFAGVTGAVTVLFAPVVAFAQSNLNVSGPPDTSRIEYLVVKAGDIIELLIPIAITLALLFFIWGLAMYILSAGNEEKKAEGKNIMIWGILALFVMISVWGIVAWIGGILGIGQGGDIPTPRVPRS